MPNATADPIPAASPGPGAPEAPHPGRSPLAAAYGELLAAFDAPFDPHVDRCAHCVADADVAALAGPVADLDPALVARAVRKAGTTWGGPADLRRLVPRALALAADHRLPLDRALLWHKLRWAGWPDWSPRQVAAVHRFLAEEWARLLRSEPRPAHAAHRWLGALPAAAADLTPFLRAWDDALGPDAGANELRPAACHLALLVNASELRPDLPGTVVDLFVAGGGADAASAAGPDDPARQLAAWLAEPATREALDHAGVVLGGTRDARRISVASERLGRFHAAWAAGPPAAPPEPGAPDARPRPEVGTGGHTPGPGAEPSPPPSPADRPER